MTDLYAVIGNPIAHSKSPAIHTAFAQQTNQDMCYEAIVAPRDGFALAVRAFRQRGGKGMNVTLPFKLEAFALATERTQRAELAGAVNTLQFERDLTIGDNTDGAGLVHDVLDHLRFPINGKRVLLMGAGGAARGVMGPLLAQRPTLLTVVNRTVTKALALKAEFAAHGSIDAGGYAELDGKTFDIVINATSASLADELPALPSAVFGEGSLAYDMVYGKGLTCFLEYARRNGAQHLADGLRMLVGQAAESFYRWRGVRPNPEPVIEMLRFA